MVIWAISNPTLISNYRLRSILFLVIQHKIEEKDTSGIIGRYLLPRYNDSRVASDILENDRLNLRYFKPVSNWPDISRRRKYRRPLVREAMSHYCVDEASQQLYLLNRFG